MERRTVLSSCWYQHFKGKSLHGKELGAQYCVFVPEIDTPECQWLAGDESCYHHSCHQKE